MDNKRPRTSKIWTLSLSSNPFTYKLSLGDKKRTFRLSRAPYQACLGMAEAENRAQRVHEHLETLCAVNKGARKRTKRETRSQNQRNPKEQKSKTASIFAKSPIRQNMRKRILSCLFIVLGMFPKLAARKTALDTSEIGNAVILKEKGIASMLAQCCLKAIDYFVQGMEQAQTDQDRKTWYSCIANIGSVYGCTTASIPKSVPSSSSHSRFWSWVSSSSSY